MILQKNRGSLPTVVGRQGKEDHSYSADGRFQVRQLTFGETRNALWQAPAGICIQREPVSENVAQDGYLGNASIAEDVMTEILYGIVRAGVHKV